MLGGVRVRQGCSLLLKAAAAAPPPQASVHCMGRVVGVSRALGGLRVNPPAGAGGCGVLLAKRCSCCSSRLPVESLWRAEARGLLVVCSTALRRLPPPLPRGLLREPEGAGEGVRAAASNQLPALCCWCWCCLSPVAGDRSKAKGEDGRTGPAALPLLRQEASSGLPGLPCWP
jgi:hypothetical protein